MSARRLLTLAVALAVLALAAAPAGGVMVSSSGRGLLRHHLRGLTRSTGRGLLADGFEEEKAELMADDDDEDEDYALPADSASFAAGNKTAAIVAEADAEQASIDLLAGTGGAGVAEAGGAGGPAAGAAAAAGATAAASTNEDKAGKEAKKEDDDDYEFVYEYLDSKADEAEEEKPTVRLCRPPPARQGPGSSVVTRAR